MNTIIKQLAILAGAKNITRCFGHGESHTALTLSNNTAYNSNEIDKFAELIIHECIAQCNDGDSAHFIASHFGIKEPKN
jgi:hypothetical protein